MKDEKLPRKTNPIDIAVPPGYQVKVFAIGLTTPINIVFSGRGEMLVADSGVTDGNGKVLLLTSRGFEVLAEGFNPPLTGAYSPFAVPSAPPGHRCHMEDSQSSRLKGSNDTVKGSPVLESPRLLSSVKSYL